MPTSSVRRRCRRAPCRADRLAPVGGGAPRQITDGQATETGYWGPVWSPDGKSIAFWASNRLKRVNVETGSVQNIALGHYGVGGSWSQNGTIVFARRFNEGLFRVNAAGGEAVPVTKIDASRRESGHLWPHFLPDGERFLYLNRTFAEERNQIAVASLIVMPLLTAAKRRGRMLSPSSRSDE